MRLSFLQRSRSDSWLIKALGSLRLFSHLVEALGPSDFLGPICMLLLEKAGSKLKQKSMDVAAFSLPLSLIESFAGRTRFEVGCSAVRGNFARVADRAFCGTRLSTTSLPRLDDFSQSSGERRENRSLVVFRSSRFRPALPTSFQTVLWPVL